MTTATAQTQLKSSIGEKKSVYHLTSKSGARYAPAASVTGAIAVFARATYQLFAQTVPTASLMSEIGILALVANLICFLLLIRKGSSLELGSRACVARHRNDNINMSSVWLCSRYDIIANSSVLITAGLVFLTGSFLPDFILGLLLTVVFSSICGTSSDSSQTRITSLECKRIAA